MINFSLLMTPHSAISLDALWELALPRVIRELSDRGYTVQSFTDSTRED